MRSSLVERVESELILTRRTYSEVRRFLPGPRPGEQDRINTLMDVVNFFKILSKSADDLSQILHSSSANMTEDDKIRITTILELFEKIK